MKVYVKFYYLGLLKGVDFCDVGVECVFIELIELFEKDKCLFLFGDFFDDFLDEEGFVVGYCFCRFIGGDICRERVDVFNYKYFGYSLVFKVWFVLGVMVFNFFDYE